MIIKQECKIFSWRKQKTQKTLILSFT